MKTFLRFLSVAVFSFLMSCQHEKKIEKFSAEKPYCIEIKKERSYYQAKKISDRLNEMGLEAYIVYKQDSTDGEWFSILSGALVNIDSLRNYRQRVEKEFKLTDMGIINFTELDSFKIVNEGDTSIIKESKKITSNKPDVPQSLIDILQKYPDNNALYLEQISLINMINVKKDYVFKIAENMNLDLPRGIGIRKITDKCNALSEVIYKDNLYGDNVTLSIMRIHDTTPEIASASFFAVLEKEHIDLAKEYATSILETDKYSYEEMKPITIQAYVKLNGYKVIIETGKDEFRTYFILVDEDFQYLFFSQSTDKTDAEMVKLLSMIGNSKGLNNYDEFYNTFYTLPERNVDKDVFLGFQVDKLSPQYAKDRSYIKWAKEMVGHWDAAGYFYNPDKGLWSFSIFDLLTEGKQQYIYGDLYSTNKQEGKYERNIYGVKGYVIYEEYVNWYTFTSETTLSEINFGIGRYAFAIGATLGHFNEADIKARAEAMQFVAGGYKSKENI